MKLKKILKISAVVLALLIAAAGCFCLIYFVPRNVELNPLEGEGAVMAGNYTILFNSKNGTFSAAKGDTTIFENAVSAYKIDGKIIKSSDYSNIEVVDEEIDKGRKITVNMTAGNLDDLVQTFYLYDDKEYFTTQVMIKSKGGDVQTNYIAPLIIENGSLQNSTFKWEKSLEVPFDNDGWVEFKVKNIWQNSVSYEVGALFTPDDGSGFIMGSLSHDTWKSGVRLKGGFGKIQTAELYCGATDPRTGDEPHGTVTGEGVESALMFIGVYDNWKEGMNEFAEANTEIQPKRASVTDTVPFGWNSWGSVQEQINYDTAVGTSQYIKDNLQSVWQEDGAAVYVNLDSWWDMLSDEELKNFVDYCHGNNQKAGIYMGPFIMWADSEDDMKNRYVPGTNDTVTYEDIRLKKNDGTYYGNEVDGCYPLDVTHPATKLHVQNQIGKFKAAGFDYIKLDFLVHASFEGDFYNKNIQTGIQAYNYGMSYVTEMLGDDMFINLAMSPTFPYHYANGRRLACDSYYHINETEYTLNAVTYGFWEQNIYDYTDPDHIVVWGRDAGASEEEARSRVTSGIISGTSFLAGDNFVYPEGDKDAARQRFITMLANKDIVRVGKTGKIFLPVITDVSNRTANIYKLETDGKLYIAVFNYKRSKKEFNIDLNGMQYSATELWSGRQETADGELKLKLAGKDAALFELVPIE